MNSETTHKAPPSYLSDGAKRHDARHPVRLPRARRNPHSPTGQSARATIKPLRRTVRIAKSELAKQKAPARTPGSNERHS
jgi:hypothetical protein